MRLKKKFYLLFGVGLIMALLNFTSPAVGDDAISSIRSSSENVESAVQLSDPKDILKDFPPFKIVKRTPHIEELGYFPCTDCHGEDLLPNPKVRVLEEEHDTIHLVHGKGRFWCLACHSLNNRNFLVSIGNQFISLDDSYLLCGQCHFQKQLDFFYGAHGKKKGNWQGERILYNCTYCHNPHMPQIKPRKPVATPKIRSGLEPMHPTKHDSEPLWTQ